VKHKDKEDYVAWEESDSEPLILIVSTTVENSHTESWYLDSGCLSHMMCH